MTRTKILQLSILTTLIFCSAVFPCTTAIISGKFTPDGRPLLFKHRDTSFLHNRLQYFSDGKYDYIGVVNSGNTLGDEVWSGSNSTGFAIMNSASYNLNLDDTTKVKDQEGRLMKKALQSCATLADFEQLLNTLPKPLGVAANFGVIDARGGAAYYETGNDGFTKFDVNDPAKAPFGYIIRTNYSYTGKTDIGYGFIRDNTAKQLFYQAAATNNLSLNFILNEVTRSLKHSLIEVDQAENLPEDENDTRFIMMRDYIPRSSSASTMIVQGVKAGESPELTTLWTMPGFQLTAVAVPTWVAGGKNLPRIMVADKNGNAPLCETAFKLKKQCFPIQRGSGSTYMNLALLLNKKGNGIMQQLRPLEKHIVLRTKAKLTKWHKKGMSKIEINEFYGWLSETVKSEYEKLFSITLGN